MRITLALVALASATVAASAVCDQTEFCKTASSGYYPDPCDPTCNAYFMCNNGQGWKQYCAAGLVWNPNANACDWPSAYPCPGAAASPGAPIASPSPKTALPSPASSASPAKQASPLASPSRLPAASPLPSPKASPSRLPAASPLPSPKASPSPKAAASPVASPSPIVLKPQQSPITGGMPPRVREILTNTDSSKILISERPPGGIWTPSEVYKWPDMMNGLALMHSQGVAGNTFWLGDSSTNGPLYGVVSVAAFLAQSMKETIRYDACDENNWDNTYSYTAANACGQLGQSYQDYKCSADQHIYECEVDTNMEIRAKTHAKWYGAPAAYFCAPKSKIPAAPYWDHSGPWCDPQVPRDVNMTLAQYFDYVKQYTNGETGSCRDYVGQQAGGWKQCSGGGCPNAPAPAFGKPARTDVEGCCWWGRGVIQTTGVCNFGKLNYFLGARAAREGRISMFPEVDFCRDPEAICASTQYPELKWIAGFYYYMTEVQPWNDGTWNYVQQLRAFVDGGMKSGDTAFIDGVSGIVNRGCASSICAAGPVDGLDDRRNNFRTVLKAMGVVAF